MGNPQMRRRKAASAETSTNSKVTTKAPRNIPSSKVFYGLLIVASLYILFWLPFNRLVGTHTNTTESLLHGVRHGVVPTFTADVARRDAVVDAFKHAWLGYERDAMGDDEYHPLSHKGSNLTKTGGIGYTLVDSIDTMLVMGLQDEYERARKWVQNHLSFDRDGEYNTFEITIRVLGGLLTAYHLSGEDPIFLEKAQDLADRMLPVFDTPSGLPLSSVNLHRREGVPDRDNYGFVSTAEAATLQLEFRYLSHLTGDDIYWEKVEEVMAVLKAARLAHGLAPIFVDPASGRYRMSVIRLGSRGDSYYEYLLKQYIQTNQTEGIYRELHDHAMTGIHDHLMKKSVSGKLLYTAELEPQRGRQGEQNGYLVPKQDHLVCFLAGSLMLGATTTGALVDHVSVPPLPDELSQSAKRDWFMGVELLKTCMATHETQTGLSAEIVHFRTSDDNVQDGSGRDWYIKGSRPGEIPLLDARYILRPEIVESLFLAFRLTGDPMYRDQGWAVFQAIEEHCRVATGGFANVKNVDQVPAEQDDKMETFLMSETLKYLYLLFADANVFPLNKYVFNTEAHPLPIFTPTIRTGLRLVN